MGKRVNLDGNDIFEKLRMLKARPILNKKEGAG
jgi:hypothetical protein